MIPIKEMNQRLAQALADRRLPAETVQIRSARGRILASDATSRLDLPPFNKSAMDGYAIREGDEQPSYRLLETVAAGAAAEQSLAAGTTIKVMTGAPVPDGAGRVVMQEHTEEKDGTVTLTRRDGAVNICRQGEDIHKDDVVLTAGTRLEALEVANLVACGITDVEVTRPVRLAIISTGDEVVDHPGELSAGKIIDTNAPLIAGLAAVHGIEIVSSTRIPDDREATAGAIRAGVEAADIVALSGGISYGDFDYVHDALADLGIRELFAGVAVKPGRPLTCAQTADGQFVVALPGNPVAVYLTFHLCLLRIATLLSGTRAEPRELTFVLGCDFERRKTDRQEYVPARITDSGTIEPVAYHGTAHLIALMQADGFLIVPTGTATLDAGSAVRFLRTRS